MNRSLTALFAALEAALVAAIGIGIPLVPLTVLWGVQYGFASDWVVFWRASVDSWLLGHGVDLHVQLDSELATALGVTGSDSVFAVTIAPLGFALLTLLLAARAGRRVGETRYRNLGALVGLGTFAVLSLLLSLSAVFPLARPSLVQGALLPTLVFAVGFAVGLLGTRRAAGDDAGSSIRDWVSDWSPSIRGTVFAALRGGTATVALVLAVSAVLITVLLAANYADVIALYEGLHTGGLGGFALTIAQIAFLPNVVVWVASWLIGPGFAIGTGSSVSALSTQLGPVPAVPLLGAVPTGDLAFGFIGLLVPIAAAFVVGAVLFARLNRAEPLLLVGTGLATGVIGGALLGLLAWFSAGAAGPGRLVQVGPDPWAVAGLAALEIGLAATAGLFAASRRSTT
jgi:hypothetical protein